MGEARRVADGLRVAWWKRRAHGLGRRRRGGRVWSAWWIPLVIILPWFASTMWLWFGGRVMGADYSPYSGQGAMSGWTVEIIRLTDAPGADSYGLRWLGGRSIHYNAILTPDGRGRFRVEQMRGMALGREYLGRIVVQYGHGQNTFWRPGVREIYIGPEFRIELWFEGTPEFDPGWSRAQLEQIALAGLIAQNDPRMDVVRKWLTEGSGRHVVVERARNAKIVRVLEWTEMFRRWWLLSVPLAIWLWVAWRARLRRVIERRRRERLRAACALCEALQWRNDARQCVTCARAYESWRVQRWPCGRLERAAARM